MCGFRLCCVCIVADPPHFGGERPVCSPPLGGLENSVGRRNGGDLPPRMGGKLTNIPPIIWICSPPEWGGTSDFGGDRGEMGGRRLRHQNGGEPTKFGGEPISKWGGGRYQMGGRSTKWGEMHFQPCKFVCDMLGFQLFRACGAPKLNLRIV